MQQCLWWRHKSWNLPVSQKQKNLQNETLFFLQIKKIINYKSSTTLWQTIVCSRGKLKIVYRIHKQATNFKNSPSTPILCEGHKYLLPMLWQMHDTNEGWSLFYQTFEISWQLAILLIFLKLLTFSGATFSSRF